MDKQRYGDLNTAISEVVAARMELHGLKPAPFGEAIDINRTTMADLVAGRSPWRVDYLEKVARGLHWSVIDIIVVADPDGQWTDFRKAEEPTSLDSRRGPARHTSVSGSEQTAEAAYVLGRDPGEPED